MGTVTRGDFGLGLSLTAEAAQRGVARSTVGAERENADLPFTRTRAVNGSIHRARQLKPSERRKRDSRIRLLLGLGLTVTQICETLDVSRGVVSRVAAKTPKRRKVHKLSRRAWRDRLPQAQ